MASLRLQGGSVAVHTPYDGRFIQAFKAAIPQQDRRWDPANKVWLIAPLAAPMVADLIQVHFGETVAVPAAITQPATPVTKLVQLLYLGRCKERSPGLWTASGYADGGWSLSFPETVLRAYFNDPERAAGEAPAPPSFYRTLGLKVFETDTALIKTAYRRMARTWHPDACKEPDAGERFRDVQKAWDVLSDGRLRRKYDAGLTFEMRHNHQPLKPYVPPKREYRSPLTCGLLLLEGIERLGVLQVGNIAHWADITNEKNQTMVSSWSMDHENFVTEWV